MSPLPFTDDDETTSLSGTLTNRQEKLLALLPIIPTILSLIGSSTIIYMVINTSKKKKLTPYNRLLFGMSICDILCSWLIPFWTLLLPKETSHRVWALGNDTTCTALGFFTQIVFAAMLYNGMISFYFLLTVRFGYKEETISKYIEPIMHFIAFIYPLTCATVGAILGVYHEVELGSGCWVNDYPDNCGNGPEQSGEKCLGPTIAWIFGGMIIFIVIISLFINNILIYCFVRNTIRQSNRLRISFPSRRMFGEGEEGGCNISTNDESTTTDGTPTKKLKSNNKNKKRKKKVIKNENQLRRIKLVATQAFLYVGGFLLSYMWTVILRILASIGFNGNDEQLLFPILILQGIFLPLQGFFNLFVYIRPNYLRLQGTYPNESKISIIYRSIFGDYSRIRQFTNNNNNNNVSPGYANNSTTTRFANFTTRFQNGATQIRERIEYSRSRGCSHVSLSSSNNERTQKTIESCMILDHSNADVENANCKQEEEREQEQEQQ